ARERTFQFCSRTDWHSRWHRCVVQHDSCRIYRRYVRGTDYFFATCRRWRDGTGIRICCRARDTRCVILVAAPRAFKSSVLTKRKPIVPKRVADQRLLTPATFGRAAKQSLWTIRSSEQSCTDSSFEFEETGWFETSKPSAQCFDFKDIC